MYIITKYLLYRYTEYSGALGLILTSNNMNQ